MQIWEHLRLDFRNENQHLENYTESCEPNFVLKKSLMFLSILFHGCTQQIGQPSSAICPLFRSKIMVNKMLIGQWQKTNCSGVPSSYVSKYWYFFFNSLEFYQITVDLFRLLDSTHEIYKHFAGFLLKTINTFGQWSNNFFLNHYFNQCVISLRLNTTIFFIYLSYSAHVY